MLLGLVCPRDEDTVFVKMTGPASEVGPEEAQAEWSIWMWNGGGDWKSGDAWAINSEANVRTRLGS